MKNILSLANWRIITRYYLVTLIKKYHYKSVCFQVEVQESTKNEGGVGRVPNVNAIPFTDNLYSSGGRESFEMT